ncbi:LysE/ArgO family amino acid transporter [Effusibacillus consociatus]|uniref:LysE/ArgO family amino acid transporter n=1 Tax=Effusibacillus consociatus TaxID=1117041 RepID=A0ABV9PWL5_9BACL
MIQAFIHGLILALGLILPLGIQNVFVFNQGALQKRFINALPVVITASLCDSRIEFFLGENGIACRTLLISLAVLGVSVGIVFLLYMGWTTWKSTPAAMEKADTDNDKEGTREAVQGFTPWKQIAFAASVSLLNPHAILDTIGVIGTSSLNYSGTEKVIFALSSILLSWIWFIGLATAGRITGQFDPSGKLVGILNRVSALVMWGSALYLFYTLLL